MYSDEELKEITTELIETFGGGTHTIASPEHEPIRFASQCKMAERIVKRKKQEVIVVLNTEDVMVSANNDSNS
jgi:hypothetical protein